MLAFFPAVQPPTRATFLLIQDLLALEVFKGEGKGQELLNSLLGDMTNKEFISKFIHTFTSKKRKVTTNLLSSVSKM